MYHVYFQDFCVTVVIAVFWLSASAAWANGLTGMKSVLGGDWIFAKDTGSVCERTEAEDYAVAAVKSCKVVYDGSFGGANVSVVRG